MYNWTYLAQDTGNDNFKHDSKISGFIQSVQISYDFTEQNFLREHFDLRRLCHIGHSCDTA
jgi:hypothetical protein